MKNRFLMAAIAAAVLADTPVLAAELPVYELRGFPISQHQVAVLGAVDVQERSPVATLTLGGMPASPSQIAILAPRRTAVELVSK